jgi:hypothetical protein
MPVDTSSLDLGLLAHVRRPAESRRSAGWWLRSWRAVAAVLLLAVMVAGLMLAAAGGPVLASPSLMAELHRDMVGQRVSAMQITSMAEASEALGCQWARGPDLPKVPEAHVQACCMRDVKNKKVACVLLESEGVLVTMTVAHASDMKMPSCPEVVRDGRIYHVQEKDGLSMVMTERQGRWVCLIAQLPAERLLRLVAGLTF